MCKVHIKDAARENKMDMYYSSWPGINVLIIIHNWLAFFSIFALNGQPGDNFLRVYIFLLLQPWSLKPASVLGLHDESYREKTIQCRLLQFQNHLRLRFLKIFYWKAQKCFWQLPTQLNLVMWGIIWLTDKDACWRKFSRFTKILHLYMMQLMPLGEIQKDRKNEPVTFLSIGLFSPPVAINNLI